MLWDLWHPNCCKSTCHMKTPPLTLLSNSNQPQPLTLHVPVRCSGRCLNWTLSGHQLGKGAPCYSCANDEHLFPVPMPSLTDAWESCDLEAAGSGNNTPAVGKVLMHHFRLWPSFTDIKTSVSHQSKLNRSLSTQTPNLALDPGVRIMHQLYLPRHKTDFFFVS